MASTLYKLSIARLILRKNQGYSYLLKQAPVLGVPNHANMTFWFFGARKSSQSAKLPASQATKHKCPKKFGRMRRKSQEKLLPNLKRKKSTTKLKLKIGKANVTQRKLSIFSRLFGRKCKKMRVDCRECNLTDLTQEMREKGDSKSQESQYRITGPIRSRPPANCKRPPFELEPAPTVPFKLPKAVMFQVMLEALEKERNQCKTGKDEEVEEDNVDDEECSALVKVPDYKEPYEEMRPIQKERVSFTCQDGIRAKHVIRPSSIESNYCNIYCGFHIPITSCKVVQESGKLEGKPAKTILNTCSMPTCP